MAISLVSFLPAALGEDEWLISHQGHIITREVFLHPLNSRLGRPNNWYCCLGTANNLLPLQGTETQFRWPPARRQFAIPTELSAVSFASAEDRKGEYTVMKQQMAVGSLRIRNSTVRRKRRKLKAVSPVFSGESRWRIVKYFALVLNLKIICLKSWT
jgi:hypothetical protein